MSSPASSSAASEGEIIESDSENKATKPQPSINGSSVDRTSRKPQSERSQPTVPPSAPRSRDPRRSRSRSRSPYRTPRGAKRARADIDDDDHYGRHDRDDRRRFRVHYEDGRFGQSRPRRDSPDRHHDDHRLRRASPNRPPRNPPDHRSRTRSRSPPRVGRDKRSTGTKDGRRAPRHEPKGLQQAHPRKGDDTESRELSVSRDERRTDSIDPASRVVMDSSSVKVTSDKPSQDASHGTQSQDESEAVTSLEVDVGSLDEAALIEQRRKRREAIKAKHRSQASPMMIQALSLKQLSPAATQTNSPETAAESSAPASTTQTPLDTPRSGSPAIIEITDDAQLANKSAIDSISRDDGPSAAEYDPTVDMEDRMREATRTQAEVSATVYEANSEQRDVSDPDTHATHNGADDDGFDMFAEQDDDDMFAASTQRRSGPQPAQPVPATKSKALDMSMLDDFDDPEGYYKIILGELLDGRYQVQFNLGRGMFSAVVRALDQTVGKPVAIKIIRSNETMRKAAMKEMEILTTLNQADPEDRKHVVRLERWFEHKGHLCMVFESLSINLREVLKKFGRDVGINLHAVRAYAQQMFLGLGLLRRCGVLHADLKPDNILVNEARSQLKICDLGSAADASAAQDVTPYLVSRFYRAPEIILGMPLDHAIDTWSVGCTLFELYTGKILFTGRSNNQMLRAIMECRGRFPSKALRRAQLAALHFDPATGDFRSVERDLATGRDVVRVLPSLSAATAKPARDLRQRLLAAAPTGSDADDPRELALFIDLLDKCLALNPERRCTPSEALRHPFITRAKA